MIVCRFWLEHRLAHHALNLALVAPLRAIVLNREVEGWRILVELLKIILLALLWISLLDRCFLLEKRHWLDVGNDALLRIQLLHLAANLLGEGALDLVG